MKLTEDAGGGGDSREIERGSLGPLYLTEFTVDVRAASGSPAVDSMVWRRCVSGEKEGPGEGSRGRGRDGVKRRGGGGRYWQVTRRQFPLTEREGEKSREKKEPTGGTLLAAREREGGTGLGWLGRCWAAAWLWAPGAAQLGWFLPFFLF
jgi:hypothetical protein